MYKLCNFDVTTVLSNSAHTKMLHPTQRFSTLVSFIAVLSTAIVIDIPSDASFMCGKATVLGAAIKERKIVCLLQCLVFYSPVSDFVAEAPGYSGTPLQMYQPQDLYVKTGDEARFFCEAFVGAYTHRIHQF